MIVRPTMRARASVGLRGFQAGLGVRAGMLSADSSCTPEAELSEVRTDRASCGPESADRAWAGRARSAGTRIDLKICGPSSFLPAMRNL